MNFITSTVLLMILVASSPLTCQGQDVTKGSNNVPVAVRKRADLNFKHESFTFVRIQYSGAGGRSTWHNDFPAADLNFSARFEKEIGLKTDPKGRVMVLTNAELRQHPFIYLVEGADMRLSTTEAKSLRDYLLGGGFLMVDDFWGETEWLTFSAEMKKVFPEREPVELSIEHPVFHSFYDIREKPQVPNVLLGTRSQVTGITWEREDAKEPHYRGLFDDNGRLMAIICHNTDLGEGWEREGENEYYSREFSLKRAYPMGINIVVYALTQ